MVLSVNNTCLYIAVISFLYQATSATVSEGSCGIGGAMSHGNDAVPWTTANI